MQEILISYVGMGLRRPHYDHTVQVKRDATMFVTGKGQDDEVTRYRRFEADSLKQQRIRVYNPLTPFALARPRKIFRKLTRIEGQRREFTTAESNAERLQELQSFFYNFQPGETLEQWLNRIIEFLGVTDPNAWLLCERIDQRSPEGAVLDVKSYPVVVGCENVLGFQKTHGVTDWLLVRNIRLNQYIENKAMKTESLEDFWLYGKGIILRAREIGHDTPPMPGESVLEIPDYTASPTAINPITGEAAKIPGPPSQKVRRFWFSEIVNGAKEVPAIQVGAYYDETTELQTFATWFAPSEHLLRDLIGEKSTRDVLRVVYAYPQEYVYTRGCEDADDMMGACMGGYYGGVHRHENLCRACKGSGKVAGFTTEQERIELVMPDDADPDKLVDLQSLSFTKPINVEFLRMLDERIDVLLSRIMDAIFDAGVFQRPEKSQSKVRTATEINAQTESVSDVLAAFANVESRAFEMFYRVTAQYQGWELQVDKSYPEDLSIESLSDMVSGFEAMKTAGVGYDAIKAQRDRINQKTQEGSPDAQARIAARNKFLPFDDKSPEEIAMIVSGLDIYDPYRILWAYFTQIFQEIEAEKPEFYKMEYPMQRQEVNDKVAEFAERIKPVSITTISEFPNFNEPKPAA